MSYTPSSAAQAAATLAGNNQAALAAPLTGLQSAIAAGNLAPAALIDAILSAAGFQIESINDLGSETTTSASLVQVPGSAINFTAPLAKTYVVHADFSLFTSNASGKGTQVQLQLVVNGSAGPALLFCVPSSQSNPNTATFHLMHAASCAAGTNIISLNWASPTGASIFTDSSCFANYIVSG